MAPPKPYVPSDMFPNLTGTDVAVTGPDTILLEEPGDRLQWYQTWRNDYTISAASNTTPVAITTVESIAGKIVTGDFVLIQGVAVTTGINDLLWKVTVTGTNSFTLDTSTAGGAGTGGQAFESSLGLFSKLIDACAFISGALGISAGDAVGDPLAIPRATTVNNTLHVTGAQTFDSTTTVTSTTGVRLTGTQPAKNADPGANNIAIATNQAKAWGLLDSDGIGGVSCLDGLNVSSVALAGSNQGWTVTLARAMASTNYVVNATYQIVAGGVSTTAWVAKTKVVSTTGFDILLQDSTTGTYVDASSAVVAVGFTVMGRQ